MQSNGKTSIESLIMIKRRGLWVNRYVTADCQTRMLLYRNSIKDKGNKYFMDLSSCEMMRGFIDKAETRPFITIENKDPNQMKQFEKAKRLTKLSIKFEDID